eukprot:1416021-Pyramimonas_sp.AAC.1
MRTETEYLKFSLPNIKPPSFKPPSLPSFKPPNFKPPSLPSFKPKPKPDVPTTVKVPSVNESIARLRSGVSDG